MSRRFRTLFTVAVEHSFYAGACTDLEFVTPSSTARVLRGGRALARVLKGRLHVLFESGAHDGPVSSLAGQTLTFGLRVVNPWFGNFTEDVVGDATLTPFYGNRADPVTLDVPDAVTLTSGVHTHTPRTATRPLTLRLSDGSGTVVDAQTLGVGAAERSFDLGGLPDGAYRLDERADGDSLASSPLYLSPELRHAGVWGILAVHVPASFAEAPAGFSLKFAARTEPLKYFVVARNFTQAEFDQLEVTDAGFGEAGRTSVMFQKVPPASFSESDLSPSLLGDDASRIVMFQSQAPVARRERGLRKIQLRRQGDVLVEHLPQPGADRSQAQFIIHVSKP